MCDHTEEKEGKGVAMNEVVPYELSRRPATVQAVADQGPSPAYLTALSQHSA